MHVELEPGERHLRDSEAVLLRGMDALDGVLTLTDKRLVFTSNAGVPGGDSEAPLSLVESASAAAVAVMGIPLNRSALGVQFRNGAEVRFRVEDRLVWIDAITDAARAARPFPPVD